MSWIHVDLGFLYFGEGWSRAPDRYVDAFLSAWERGGLPDPMLCQRDAGPRTVSLREWRDEICATAEAESGIYLTTDRSSESYLEVAWSSRSVGAGARIIIRGGAVSEFGEAVAEQLPVFLDALASIAEIKVPNIVSLCVQDIEFEQPRPPRQMFALAANSIVDVLAPVPSEWDNSMTVELLPKLERMRHLPLPSGVERRQLTNVTVIRWASSLDEESVTDRMSLRAQWLAKFLEFEVQSGFNEFGDQRFSLAGLPLHDDVTYYDRDNGIAYKAVVVFEDGSVDESLFREMKDWTEKGVLPNGDSLEQLNLIFPNRKAALAGKEKLEEIGGDYAFYTDEVGSIWDLEPENVVAEEDSRLRDLEEKKER